MSFFLLPPEEYSSQMCSSIPETVLNPNLVLLTETGLLGILG